MKKALKTLAALAALAIVIWLTICFTNRWKEFSPLRDESAEPRQAAISPPDAPARFYSCIEKQRIMRDEGIYHGEIDGDRGPLTIAAEAEHARLYGDWAAKETAK